LANGPPLRSLVHAAVNAANRFNKYGGRCRIPPWKSFKITAGITCSIFDDDGCRKNFSFVKSC